MGALVSISTVSQLSAKFWTVAVVGLAVAAITSSAGALAASRQDSEHGKWTVFVVEEGGKKCYMQSKPVQKSPASLKWQPTVYVMRSKATEGREEPSVKAGYVYQQDSTVTISVGSDTFTLFTAGDGAWVLDAGPEKQLVDAMKAGSTMIVKGMSERGNVTTDTYSLSGVTAGINRLKKLCP